MNPVNIENLKILIAGLEKYKDEGVVDPWVLDTGEIIEPLEVLKELLASRELVETIKRWPMETEEMECIKERIIQTYASSTKSN